MHQQIGDYEDRERHRHQQVAPVPAGNDFTGRDGEQSNRERQVSPDRQPRRKIG